ncbi:restriction endonuclease subunit S [Agrobacterium rosae]|uniref:restriction endonuclease subunit S n=1 Tax=Agrobacterium rosae TaxID=1972867 RepID=UPI00122EEC4D|nr:restriction endonuclease subunit S [Agrobacterium rosae]KAA3506313.1 restriction endonuclease subunit S [Agrobacterium rosae]KAA3510833.1 restriction endonuclease subunit S [Agrobacterium rosae]MQB51380.1 restriction endonuclease subunit S [Agrobacterium rosae]
MVRLEEVCEVNPRAPKNIKDDAAVSFIPMSAVSEDGHIFFEDARTYGDVKKGYTYFERGDVLVAKITPCFENGKAASTEMIQNKLGFGSTEFHVLRPSKDLYPKYVFYLIWSERFRKIGEKGMTGSAGQKRVPADLLRRLEIPLPPLDEQKRIAAILDKADALRAKRRQAIALLDSLTKSIFLEIFGEHNPTGNDSTLLDIADIQIGYPFKSERYTEASDGIKLCRGANILPNKIDWSDLAKWPIAETAIHADYALQENDIVVAMDRPWISTGFKIASITSDDLPALLVQRVARIRAKKKNDAYFIYELMRGSAFTRHCRPTETTIPHISPKDFRSFEFNFGRDSDRLTFSERARHIYTTKDKLELQMTYVENLFASLQHRAFTGQL